jgi:hypothetical protein
VGFCVKGGAAGGTRKLGKKRRKMYKNQRQSTGENKANVVF